jgi:hypothetical protein
MDYVNFINLTAKVCLAHNYFTLKLILVHFLEYNQAVIMKLIVYFMIKENRPVCFVTALNFRPLFNIMIQGYFIIINIGFFPQYFC